jgi:hypothetical protein
MSNQACVNWVTLLIVMMRTAQPERLKLRLDLMRSSRARLNYLASYTYSVN